MNKKKTPISPNPGKWTSIVQSKNFFNLAGGDNIVPLPQYVILYQTSLSLSTIGILINVSDLSNPSIKDGNREFLDEDQLSHTQ